MGLFHISWGRLFQMWGVRCIRRLRRKTRDDPTLWHVISLTRWMFLIISKFSKITRNHLFPVSVWLFLRQSGTNSRNFNILVLRYVSKKKLQNLNDNFDPNIYRSFKNFVSQKLQIFSAFQRGALHKCSWGIQETSGILVKLVRNWNIKISSKCANF